MTSKGFYGGRDKEKRQERLYGVARRKDGILAAKGDNNGKVEKREGERVDRRGGL